MPPSPHTSAPYSRKYACVGIRGSAAAARAGLGRRRPLPLGSRLLLQGLPRPAGGGADLRRPGVGARPLRAGPLTLGLAPHGWGKYRYCLDHETGRIGFTSSRRLPSVRIQPRAEFLHAVGPEETVRHFADLVRPFIEGLVLSVARLDLFVDMEGMQLCAQDRSAFVCRGDGCTTYENANTVTGFAFGSRRTQRISARLYDKTAEMALKGNDWWELVWGDRHTPGAQVWRIEFEVGRAALSDLELFRPEAVLAAVPSLWAYCTGEWLTLRSPSCGLQPFPVAGRSSLAGRAGGITRPRRHRAAVHPGAQTGHPPSQSDARPRRVPRRLRRGEGDLRHRRHLRGAPRRRGQRRDRPPHDLRRAGPAPSSRKGFPVSTERHDSTTGTEREGGRRQAPDGEGRPRGRALAGRPLGLPPVPCAVPNAASSVLRRRSSPWTRLRADWGRACVTSVGWWPSGGSPSSRSVASSASMRMRWSTGSTTTGSPSCHRETHCERHDSVGRRTVVPGSGSFIEGGVAGAVDCARSGACASGAGSTRPATGTTAAATSHRRASTTKGDARAFLSAVETDIRRGVWIDPWAGRLRVSELAAGVDRLQPDQAGVDHCPGGADPPSPRAADDRRASASSGSGPGTSSGWSTPGGPSTLPGRSSGTTRSCEPCSATPCATTGWPGIRVATSTCRRSRALAAST